MVLFTINSQLDLAIRLLLTATRSALICQFAMMSLTTWEKATPTLEKTAGPSLMQMAMNWRLARTRMALRMAHLETALVDVQMPPLATTTLTQTLTMQAVSSNRARDAWMPLRATTTKRRPSQTLRAAPMPKSTTTVRVFA